MAVLHIQDRAGKIVDSGIVMDATIAKALTLKAKTGQDYDILRVETVWTTQSVGAAYDEFEKFGR